MARCPCVVISRYNCIVYGLPNNLVHGEIPGDAESQKQNYLTIIDTNKLCVDTNMYIIKVIIIYKLKKI